MAFTTTTTSAAVLAGDTTINLTSVSGLVGGMVIQIDQEFMEAVYSSTTIANPVKVRRGTNGTIAAAHPSSANANYGIPSDFADPAAATVVAYPLSARRRAIVSYSASGAITLPTKGEDMIAVLNGTSTLAMTLADPGKDNDGDILYIIGNAKSSSTVTQATAFGNAGSNYVKFTFQNAGDVCVPLMACNGIWVPLNTPITGTSTALSVGIGA